MLHMCPNCQIQYDRYQPVIEKEFGVKYDMVHMNIAQFVAFQWVLTLTRCAAFRLTLCLLKGFWKRMG